MAAHLMTFPMPCPGFAERWEVWGRGDVLGDEPGLPEIASERDPGHVGFWDSRFQVSWRRRVCFSQKRLFPLGWRLCRKTPVPGELVIQAALGS